MTFVPATLAELLQLLPDAHIPLHIELPDGPLAPGFHVTELIHVHAKSLDCGRGEHAWEEVVLQLLDSTTGHPIMATKLRGIFQAGLAKNPTLASLPIRFEGGLGNMRLERFALSHLDVTPTHVTVKLAPLAALCKPARAQHAGVSCCA